ncbi:MAG TPA: SPOR domain-containing protein [Candidatus Acidoferrales bacterium]|nr:SPOR domain-containing protein [Candidatus Acidoferrales bacterium]
MGFGTKRGGGDRVLESRHLVGLFLGVVLLCCVFFTLGYVMGRTQYGNTPVQAAPAERPPLISRSPQTAASQPPSSPEWDFYTNKKNTDIPLKPAPTMSSRPIESVATPRAPERQPVESVVSSRNSSATPARFRPPMIPRGAIVLQVGALKSESDALALADALQKKSFPAFVMAPASDSFYRVQVGPYATQAAGDRAKQSLEREGFKAIFKR